MEYTRKNKSLKSLLSDLNRRKNTVDFINTLIKSANIFAGWLLLLHLADWIFILPATVRIVLSVVTLTALPVFLVYLSISLLRRADYRKISCDIEKAVPELKQEISTAVQFSFRLGNRENYSTLLIERLISRAEEKLGNIDPDDILKINIFPFGKIVSAGLVLIILLILFSPYQLIISFQRYTSPRGVVGKWLESDILPGDCRIAKGSDLEINVSFKGSSRRAKIEWQNNDGKTRTQSLSLNQGRLGGMIPAIQSELKYRILLGRKQSPRYLVKCHTPLLLSDIKIKIVPPSYTKLFPYSLENQGNITALRGSRAYLTARSTLPLKEAELTLEATGKRPIALDQDSLLSAEFMVTGQECYSLWGRTAAGDTFVNSDRYQINCLNDEFPIIELTYPENEIMLGEDMTVNVNGLADDDFGLTAIRLGFLYHEATKKTDIIACREKPKDTAFSYIWQLGELPILPGDSVVYWLEATDNDAVSGPKTGRSKKQIIRIPTIEDIYRSLVQADSGFMEEVEATQFSHDQLKQEIDRLAQSIKESRKIDWRQQAAAEDVLQKQQELLKQLEKAMEQAAESIKDRQSKWSFDQETMEKLAQLRELFDQVATDQMRQDMEKLKQSLGKLDKQEVSRALENLKLSQEDFKRQLDQTMAMLKELQQEQQMEKLDRQINDIIKRQSELKERTERSSRGQENKKLSAEQEQLAQELGSISQDMEKMAAELSQTDKEASEQLKKNFEQLSHEQTGQKMESAAQSLSENDNSQAADLQKQVLSELSTMSSGMQSARNSMRRSRNQAAAKAVQQKAKDLIDLSKQQEGLNLSSTSASGNSNDLANQQQIIKRQAARLQQELDNMSRNNMMLSPLSQQQLQEAIRQMAQAGQAFYEGNTGNAQKGGQKALAALNSAALSLMEGSGSSSGGSGDMIQDLSGLSQQQQAVNEGTGDLMPLPGDGQPRLSQKDRSLMSRLAAQQEAVRQGMEGFNQRYAGRQDKTGRLDDLAEEIKRVVEDLKNQQVSRETIERQEKILTRMLDAQQSLQERDFSRKRKAETGRLPENVYRPPNIDRGKWTPQGLPAWRNWRQEYYPQEYQEVLEEYFKSLGQ